MPLIRFVLAILLAASLLSPAAAQTVSSRGMGSATFGMRLSPEVRAKALEQARINALEAHVAQSGPARLRLFEERREEFLADINRFILASVTLSEDEDRKAKRYTIVIRADINAALLQAKFDAGSATASAHASERSILSFVFVARSQDSVQRFQDRQYERVDASRSVEEKTTEGESFGRSTISTSGGISQTGSTSVTRGGSTTQRSDAILWKVANANEINTSMIGQFSAAGYEVVEAEYVEAESNGLLNVANIRRDFSTGNDLQANTLRDTANGFRAAGIPYFAIGTLDIGMKDIDPVTGSVRVHVTVTGKVMDVTSRFPRTVSSVGPVQFAGLGPTESVARTNALQQAAEQAAQQIVNELNNRDVR